MDWSIFICTIIEYKEIMIIMIFKSITHLGQLGNFLVTGSQHVQQAKTKTAEG